MNYLPQNLLMDYQRMKAESLLGLKPATPMPYQLPQLMPKEYGMDAYQGMGSLMSMMNEMNARMNLQQMAAAQRPDQILISQLAAQNDLLQMQVKTLTAEKDRLAKELESAEGKLKTLQSQAPAVDASASELIGKKKRHRRPAKEIAREFKCPKETCAKCYGSEGSLNQHIRLKHPEIEIPKSNTSQVKQISADPSAENHVEETSSKACSENCKSE